jgi:hypothetical protein
MKADPYVVKAWPERRVITTWSQSNQPKVKVELNCGHIVYRQRKPKLGATIVCEQCSATMPTYRK